MASGRVGRRQRFSSTAGRACAVYAAMESGRVGRRQRQEYDSVYSGIQLAAMESGRIGRRQRFEPAGGDDQAVAAMESGRIGRRQLSSSHTGLSAGLPQWSPAASAGGSRARVLLADLRHPAAMESGRVGRRQVPGRLRSGARGWCRNGVRPRPPEAEAHPEEGARTRGRWPQWSPAASAGGRRRLRTPSRAGWSRNGVRPRRPEAAAPGDGAMVEHVAAAMEPAASAGGGRRSLSSGPETVTPQWTPAVSAGGGRA